MCVIVKDDNSDLESSLLAEWVIHEVNYTRPKVHNPC